MCCRGGGRWTSQWEWCRFPRAAGSCECGLLLPLLYCWYDCQDVNMLLDVPSTSSSAPISNSILTSNENHSHPTVTCTINDEGMVGIDSDISEVKDVALFIEALHSATLEKSGMDPDHTVQLRDVPSKFPFDVHNPHFLFPLRTFFVVTNSSQDMYNKIHAAALECYPDNPFPSFNVMKRRVESISSVNLITHDMCINSCIGYTRLYTDHDTCFVCGQSHYDDYGSKPRRQFNTIPIRPVLQALYCSPESTKKMQHWVEWTASILEYMKTHKGKVEVYDDILCGQEYLDTVQNCKINDSHILIEMSLDGAQLFENKQSDCWMYLWLVFELSQDFRYKKAYVIPSGTIGGPNEPKHITSFLFPGLYHVSALQKEGLWVWDGILLKHVKPKHPYFILCMADGPAMAELSVIVSHRGKLRCRLYCGIIGWHWDRDNHYNPVMLKPVSGYNVLGCSHDDVMFKDLLQLSDGIVTAECYWANIQILASSCNPTQYNTNQWETGLTQPTIFDGLDSRHTLGIPNIFGLDIMHLNSLNDTDLFLSLWRGTIQCYPPDSKENWDWAVFCNTALWEAHGKTISMSTEYFPFSFDHPPRNLAEKLNSGYKAWEFLLYLFGLGPALLRDILPVKYWANYCKGSRGIQIFQQHHISPEHLREGAKLLAEFIREFEELYYQWNASQLYFIWHAIHLLIHLAFEALRLGPPCILLAGHHGDPNW